MSRSRKGRAKSNSQVWNWCFSTTPGLFRPPLLISLFKVFEIFRLRDDFIGIVKSPTFALIVFLSPLLVSNSFAAKSSQCSIIFGAQAMDSTFDFPHSNDSFNLLDPSSRIRVVQDFIAPLLVSGNYRQRLGLVPVSPSQMRIHTASIYGVRELYSFEPGAKDSLGPFYQALEDNMVVVGLLIWKEKGHFHVGLQEASDYRANIFRTTGMAIYPTQRVYKITNPLVKLALLERYAHSGVYMEDLQNISVRLGGKELGNGTFPLLIWRKSTENWKLELSSEKNEPLNPRLTLFVLDKETAQKFFDRLTYELEIGLPSEVNFHHFSSWVINRTYDENSASSLDSQTQRRQNSRAIMDAIFQEITQERKILAARSEVFEFKYEDVLAGNYPRMPRYQLDITISGRDAFLAWDFIMAILSSGDPYSNYKP